MLFLVVKNRIIWNSISIEPSTSFVQFWGFSVRGSLSDTHQFMCSKKKMASSGSVRVSSSADRLLSYEWSCAMNEWPRNAIVCRCLFEEQEEVQVVIHGLELISTFSSSMHCKFTKLISEVHDRFLSFVAVLLAWTEELQAIWRNRAFIRLNLRSICREKMRAWEWDARAAYLAFCNMGVTFGYRYMNQESWLFECHRDRRNEGDERHRPRTLN